MDRIKFQQTTQNVNVQNQLNSSDRRLENSGTASDDISHENDIIKNLMNIPMNNPQLVPMNIPQVTDYYDK